jgi:DNA-binding NarL/FixJ family response regulator
MTILLCTQSKTLLEHWKASLVDIYSDLINITTETGLQKCLDANSDVILLLDSNFFINVKEYLKSLKESYPSVNTLFLDDCPTFRVGKSFLQLGIKGYGNSRLSAVHLLQAISVMNTGNVWLYPEFIQELIKETAHKSEKPKSDKLKLLTNKEKEIAKLVSDGCSNKIIATKCKVAESTVKVHLRKVYDKLHVTDRLSLALLIR